MAPPGSRPSLSGKFRNWLTNSILRNFTSEVLTRCFRGISEVLTSSIIAQWALRAFAQTCLQTAHFEGAGSRGVTKTGEMKNAVENIGQKFIAEAEAVALA